jgi:hypothetical protein
VTDKFEFIDVEYAKNKIANVSCPVPTIRQMCDWIEVSRSGFYEWRDRPASMTAARRETLKALITSIFDASKETYGYRRVHAALLRQGRFCGPELVRALMRELGYSAHRESVPRRTPWSIIAAASRRRSARSAIGTGRFCEIQPAGCQPGARAPNN